MAVAETAGSAVHAAGRAPVPHELGFLRMMAYGDNWTLDDLGSRFITSGGWRLTGRVDPDLLRMALDDVVHRHEALRTRVVPGTQDWYQEVQAPCSPQLEIMDLPDSPDQSPRETRAEQFLHEIEARTYHGSSTPLLWACLGRFDDTDSVLALVAHGTMVDGWSLNLIVRDLSEYYAAHRDNRPADLPTVKQYREYAVEQQEVPADDYLTKAYDYWREKLRGARPMIIPADEPDAVGGARVTELHRFSVSAELGLAVTDLAKQSRSTPFMVLFSVYLVLLRKMTGESDGVVSTLSPGPARSHRATENTVGFFVNTLSLRTDITGCRTFRDVLERARTTCIEAYSNEVQITELVENAPDVMADLDSEGSVCPTFEVLQFPFGLDGRTVGDVAYAPMRRTLSQDVGHDIPPDAFLFAVEIAPSGELLGSIACERGRFEPARLSMIIEDYRSLVVAAVSAPDASLEWL